MPYTLVFVAMVALFLVTTMIAIMSRYHRCPSNQILVKYGNVGRDKAALPIHGGATFVWPVLQSYAFLDLTPMTIDIDLKGALSKQNIRMNVPSRFTIGIATDEEGMNNAAVRLLGESQQQIEALAKDIIFGQAGIGPEDVDVAQLYDAFSPLIPLSLEGYGFCKRGEGADFTNDGALEWPDGRLPTNTSGGGMSEAYVHGFNLISEGVRQIRGTSTAQVEGAEWSLVTSGEGVPTSALLLRRG